MATTWERKDLTSAFILPFYPEVSLNKYFNDRLCLLMDYLNYFYRNQGMGF